VVSMTLNNTHTLSFAKCSLISPIER
jgi:hypothetical protein